MRPSSVPDTAGGRRSLGHPAHDKVWQRLDDHGITVAMHSGDSGYGFLLEHWGVDSEFESFRYNALKSMLTYSPISDALASLLAEGVLSRHRNLRVATIETGSEWVWPFVKKLTKTYRQQRHAFEEDPLEVFRRQVWISPYYEDDLLGLRDLIRSGSRAVRLGLPPRRGLGRSGVVRARPSRVLRRRDQAGHAHQRAVAHPTGRSLIDRCAFSVQIRAAESRLRCAQNGDELDPRGLHEAADGRVRCWWPGEDEAYVAYHDTEWGRPVTDDNRLFEKLCLEGFQSGLSWPDHPAQARQLPVPPSADLKIATVAAFGAADIERLVSDAGIVRHRGQDRLGRQQRPPGFPDRRRIPVSGRLHLELGTAQRTGPAGRQGLGPSHNARLDRLGQGPEAAGVDLRRPHHRLRLHAVDGPGQRPHRRLFRTPRVRIGAGQAGGARRPGSSR